MSQFKAKMHQIQFRLGLCLQCSPRGSLWELPTLPRPSWFTCPGSSKTLALYKSCTYLLTYLLTYFKGSTFKGGEKTGKERMGKEEGKGKDGEWDGMGKWRKGRGKEGKKGPGGTLPGSCLHLSPIWNPGETLHVTSMDKSFTFTRTLLC